MNPPAAAQPSFLVSGGEMGRRIREFDWAQTPLSSPDTWPQSLRSALSICLGGGFPGAICWGGGLTLLYNDAWSPIPAAAHPWALGRPAREAWPEMAPLLHQVQTTGEPARCGDERLPVRRRGFTEECYFDLTFSPILDEAGAVGGVFHAAFETTARVLAERRTELLRDLAASTVDAPTPIAVAWRTAAAFEGGRHDLPFVLLYLTDPAGGTASLEGCSGVGVDDQGHLPQTLDLQAAAQPFPLVRAAALPEGAGLLLKKEELAFLGPVLQCGPWPEPVEQAVIHALTCAEGGAPAGYLVAGLSPRLAWDEEYRSLLSLAAHGVATALDRARAHAAGRERAEKLAELDRAKTNFFSSISHEFRTPLTLLLSPLEEILARPPDQVAGEIRELATGAQRNAQRLLRLINTLLEVKALGTAAATRPPAGRHHVLLADDNGDMRSYITRLLSPHYEVTAVVDGVSALAAVRARRPDLVLSDVVMPRLDGFGLLHALRGDPATSTLPVILLSARAGEEARVEGVQHGADDYLVKPFSARELLARVSTHLELGRIRALAAEELRTSEERYRAFIANSSEGIWRLEIDPPLDTTLPVEQQVAHAYAHGRMAECNDTMARMYGLEKGADLLGSTLDAMLPQADPAARDFVASIIRGGYRATDVESTERDVNGNLIHFSNTMAGEVEGGLLKRIWGTQRDISERHRAQQHQRWLADFPGQNPNPIFEVNLADNTVFYANSYALERAPDLKELGLRHPFLVHLKGAVQTLEEGRQQVMQREICVDGIWYMQSLRLMPAINHVRIYCTDISALKKAEQQLRENEETLRAARDVAEQASRAKDSFLAMLSHELRTPLTPVLMAVAALEQDTTLRPEVREDLAMMRRNIELETRLIDDLLDLNRITTGKLALDIEAVDLNQAVRHVCGICRPQLQERDIRLDTELDPKVNHVAADPARLQQVLWNVLKNAIKFTPTHGTIHVSTRRISKDSCEVRVKDSGVGIPTAMLPRIFDAFQQGDVSVTRRFGGLGLGLAICKALMDMHHGAIRAESAGPGSGSTFIIEIPGQVMTATTRIRLTRPQEARSGPQLRLLVVDDHPDTLRTLTRLLTRAGFHVLSAASVAQAVAVAEKESFDMLVSDIGLPDGDGHEVMRRVRSLHQVPGIAMSGYGTDDDQQRSLEAGFSEHLTKPVDFATLQRAINRLAAKVSAGDNGPSKAG